MKRETEKKAKKSKEENKKDLTTFIKTHVLKKTSILTIIGMLLFVLVISVFASASDDITDELQTIEKSSLINDIKERFVILLLILFAGWVPYFYIPAVAFGAYMFMLAGDVALAMETHGKFATLLLNILPTLIDILTVSIITAIGIYITSYTTKKYRYTQRTSFSFLDVKIQIYQMTKKQDKYEDAIAKKQERIDKMKENDVKTDYGNIIKIVPAVIAINIIACIIEHFINS